LEQLMTEEERIRRGQECFKKVHGDALQVYKAGAGVYSDMALRNIYNDVWGREVMSVRERRLAVMGALAAMGVMSAVEKHLRSILSLNERSWEEIQEIGIALSPYIGAARAGDFLELVSRLKAEAASGK
jgi:4-carboxymuconolactone decarboxylase